MRLLAIIGITTLVIVIAGISIWFYSDDIFKPLQYLNPNKPAYENCARDALEKVSPHGALGEHQFLGVTDWPIPITAKDAGYEPSMFCVTYLDAYSNSIQYAHIDYVNWELPYDCKVTGTPVCREVEASGYTTGEGEWTISYIMCPNACRLVKEKI